MNINTAFVIIFSIIIMVGSGVAAVWHASKDRVSSDMAISTILLEVVFLVFMFNFVMSVYKL